jgi:hypothetical protein
MWRIASGTQCAPWAKICPNLFVGLGSQMQEKGSQLPWGRAKNLAAVHARTNADTAAAIIMAASAGGSRLHQVVGRHHPVEVTHPRTSTLARFLGIQKLWMLLKNPNLKPNL